MYRALLPRVLLGVLRDLALEVLCPELVHVVRLRPEDLRFARPVKGKSGSVSDARGRDRAAAQVATGGRPCATAARRASLVNDFRICGNPSGMVNPFWYRLDMMDANAK